MTNIKQTILTFKVSLDQEEPDLVAGLKIEEWQKSETGKWLVENATVSWHRHRDLDEWHFQYSVTAILTPENYTFWSLKYT